MEEKEISIFDYLPKVLPILDVIFIVWIALTSPRPWITTPIHLAMPAFGFTALLLFREKGRIGFYLIGTATSLPLFFLNHWASPDCPTWLTEISFIGGGLMLTNGFNDRVAVLIFVLATTIFPFLTGDTSWNFRVTILISELAMWFLMERSVAFMDMQKAKIKRQKELVEEKQREIIASIHYAKRIQTSLLPSERKITNDLNRN
jgi:hypothetical protein